MIGFLKRQTLVDKLKIHVTFFFILILDVLILVKISTTHNKTLEDIMTSYEAVGSYLQMTTKILTLIIYNGDLKQILAMTNQFWKYDKFGPVISNKQQKYPRMMPSFITAYFFFCICTLTVLMLKPVLFHELPRSCCIPEGEVWFYVVSAIQNETLFYCTFTVFAFDAMFALLYTEAAMQFCLLNEAFSRMKNHGDLKECVDYHVFLYNFVKKLNDVYWMFLLVQSFDCLSETCFQLLTMVHTQENLTLRVKAVLYAIALYMQLSFFCFPVGFLQDESQASSTAISACPWYLKDAKFKRSVFIVMIRAQKKISVRAGGFFEMDRQAFIYLCKSSFSVYTLLKSIN
uniref:Odorant receptor n=1 Tax=Colaphellus bowringi TaxID=561076 RepID=A0A0S3J2N7_9CUCU|nr:odorant receptor OR1 [Colaphellus bowringi]